MLNNYIYMSFCIFLGFELNLNQIIRAIKNGFTSVPPTHQIIEEEPCSDLQVICWHFVESQKYFCMVQIALAKATLEGVTLRIRI